MGLFPEDYKIPVSALLNLWIAEEFVLNVDTENYMEEAARVCLNDLLNRSLVMVSKRRRNGDIKYCILHDVVREFCSAKLREEKFVQLIVPYNPYKHLYTKESRLCTYIHDDLVEQLDHCEYQVDKITIHESEESTKCFGQCSKPSLEFIAHPEFETWKNRSNPLRLLVELKLVRVLHLMDVETSSSWVPTVKLLTHLRYLALYVKDQFEFKWVSHLHDLHTLKVASRKTLFPRSSGLWKMNNLRHVNMRKVFLLLENEEEESSETLLENLKTFCNLRVYDDRNPRSWWRFPNLEELGLSLESLPCRSLFPISEVHTRLQSLDLECPCKTYRYPHSVGWESYFVFPSNLKNLRIRHFSITKELTSNIARLQKLEKLKIIWGLLLGKECWDVREMEFQALKYLTLEWMDLREWKASEESFPVLEKLLIKGCYSLDAIPPSFADIPTLQLIELYGCPDSVEDSAMNIKREIEETTGRAQLLQLACSHNFSLWKAQMSMLMHGHNLFGHLDGSKPTPSQTISANNQASSRPSRRLSKDSRPIVDYLHQVRSLCVELATAGSPVSNEELVVKILTGLGSEFRGLFAAIRARDSTISYEELYEKLLYYELFLHHEEAKRTPFAPITANIAQGTA
uniref:Late blight resistance protein homolog R1C-3 n=1 Tax=Nicotiana tabacum TaxID=4097 RepID=A0A1S3Y840_TOBAC